MKMQFLTIFCSSLAAVLGQSTVSVEYDYEGFEDDGKEFLTFGPNASITPIQFICDYWVRRCPFLRSDMALPFKVPSGSAVDMDTPVVQVVLEFSLISFRYLDDLTQT